MDRSETAAEVQATVTLNSHLEVLLSRLWSERQVNEYFQQLNSIKTIKVEKQHQQQQKQEQQYKHLLESFIQVRILFTIFISSVPYGRKTMKIIKHSVILVLL